LQALYIALYGSYKGKYLYLDILSGRHADDFEEEKYYFYFTASKKANEQNKEAVANQSSDEEDDEIKYFVKVSGSSPDRVGRLAYEG